jgi:putative FmdB family regulatory protein
MPIYEYQCTACGHAFDTLQKVSEPALTDCPACQQANLQKMVSAPSFQLKGTGWYATDFKNKANNEPKKADNAAVSATANSTPATHSTTVTEADKNT